MTPEPNWVLLIAPMLFSLLTVVMGVFVLYWFMAAGWPRVQPSRAARWISLPAGLVALANLVAQGAAILGNAAAATFAPYLNLAMMVLLSLWMGALALLARRLAARSPSK